jgi:hypothetical protein
MTDKGIKTEIAPGIIARVAAGLRYAFTGKGPEWFGPNEPLEPMAPPEAAGRAFDYPMAINMTVQPRSGEGITFPMLRALADSYDVLRLVIETRKDQIAKMDWQIVPRDEDKGRAKISDPRIDALTDFFAYPDRVHSWGTWLRIMLEDMLVIDAPTIYPRFTKGGQIYAFEPVDGGTIKCLIDANGRTPAPPDPAYQQILKGLPATEYTAPVPGPASVQLVYCPRNPRAHKIYGYGPVEQIIMSVNMALRRQMHQMDFYTEGTIPDALLETPADWTVDQIKEFQLWWDSILSGQTAQRRKVRFIPGGMKPHFTKEAILKDEMDEWLARIVCYCFSVPPTPFVKMMNRATAATAAETALQEGLIPLLKWAKDLMDFLIVTYFGYQDIEFKWKTEVDVEPKTQAEIDASDVSKAIRTLDEVREARGLPPYEGGLGAKPLIYTAGGAVLLEEALKPPEPMPAPLEAFGGNGGGENPPGGPPAPPPGPGKGKPVQGEGDNKAAPSPAPEKMVRLSPEKIAEGRAAIKRLSESMAKARRKQSPVNPIDRERPLLKAQTGEMAGTLAAGFKEVSKDVVPQVIKEMPDAPPEDIAAEVSRILGGLDLDGINAVVAGIQENLEKVAQDGAAMALTQINYDAEGITDLLDERALAYAQDRAAELVGKKWVDGELVDNPNAEWSIAENTREMLRGDISQAIEEGWSNDKLASVIEENYGFSPERSEMIARTETAFADVAGNMEAYRESGLVSGKEWIMGSEHDLDDECNENAAAGVVPLDEPFPSGDMDPPAHPNACFEGFSFAPYGSLRQMLRSRYNGPAVTIEAEFIDNPGQATFCNSGDSANFNKGNIPPKKLTNQSHLAGINRRRSPVAIPSGRINITIGPNHPVLTQRGFVLANQIIEGDQLLYDSRCKSSVAGGHSDFKEGINFEDIFESLLSICGHSNIAGPRNYFHGDEVAIYGEVDVVRPTRDLLPVLNPIGIEKLAECDLMGAYPEADHVTGCSACKQSLERVFSSTPGDMSRSDLSLSFFGGKGRPPEFHLLRIVACHKTSFEGWAFDASTEYSIYNMGGVVVKNCVCDVLPVLAESEGKGGE